MPGVPNPVQTAGAQFELGHATTLKPRPTARAPLSIVRRGGGVRGGGGPLTRSTLLEHASSSRHRPIETHAHQHDGQTALVAHRAAQPLELLLQLRQLLTGRRRTGAV